MTNEQWAQVESTFDALWAVPPAERAERLAAIADEKVRREVASLLEYSTDSEGDTVVSAVGAVAVNLPQADRRIGPYRLGPRVGQGCSMAARRTTACLTLSWSSSTASRSPTAPLAGRSIASWNSF